MPRLASEGVVGADAIFACLGPALEIYSRYSRVEKSSGEVVNLREYLEQVWSVVASEALAMIFADVDAGGLEADARLTAMWLWTLMGGSDDAPARGRASQADDDDVPGAETTGSERKPTGFALEYDAARKIAQGLGVHLDRLGGVVEVKGDSARLLGVEERLTYLVGSEAKSAEGRPGRKRAGDQGSLFDLSEFTEQREAEWLGSAKGAPHRTTLDWVHQAMLLFAAGRGEALRRFLTEGGAGSESRFWQLAQALSALYPLGTNERRWVEGVLARKKPLGL